MATPTPMPIFVPELVPEPVALPSAELVSLGDCGEAVFVPVCDAVVLPPPLVTEDPGVAVPPFPVFALVAVVSAVVEPESFVVLAGDAAPDVGVWPAKNWTVSPVLWGSEAMLARLLASRNATVADAASVQLQNEPGWSVVGFPSWEQAAQAPSLLSQSVRAIHGASRKEKKVSVGCDLYC